MHLVRAPLPALAPWVSQLFVRSSDGGPSGRQERTLPTGGMHCVFRLADAPIRLAEADGAPVALGHSLVCGARSRFYLRDLPGQFVTVGALLKPGASLALFGAPADALAERHTRLDALWDHAADAARERLGETATGEAQLQALEAIFLERLRARALSPLVSFALTRLVRTDDVSSVVEESGYSHRVFIERFRAEVGLTPKRYCRVRRFQHAVKALELRPRTTVGAIAAATGFADQAHLDRDFREMAGLSPSAHRAALGGSISSKRSARHG